MQRRFKDYLIISSKGLAMGAADAVPGVSGGTIAFISGIYEELISSISNVNISLFKTLFSKGLKAFWIQANGNFVLALLSGVIISYVSFMKLAKYLLENQPVLIWSFFFGLIIASIYFVGKQISKWNIPVIMALIIGTGMAFYITMLPALSQNESSYFLFFAGAIAICAMILPGISGSFILIILGAYKTLSDAINDIDVKKIVIFVAGAVIGLLSFSHVLKWLFKNYHNITLALLTGFIFGSLNKVWPWKETLSWHTNSKGIKSPLIQESISPLSFEGDNQLVFAIILMVLGFLTIFILEKVGSRK
ncbi:MAG: putative membrane protein [Mariniflexile sp.]|jgi:putative membrane protein